MEEVVPVTNLNEVPEIKTAEEKDNEILSLYNHPGWKQLDQFISLLIEDRKNDSGIREGESPSTYGTRRLADDEAIKDLTKVKEYVEAIAKFRDGEGRNDRG